MRTVLSEKWVLLLVSLLVYSSLFAQSGFRNGYIVTSENDSVSGLINVYPGKQNIKYVTLLKGDEKTEYYPHRMKRFGYPDGDCYVTDVLKDTILQVLVEGRLSLYKSQSALYIQKKGDKLERLSTYTKKIISNGEMHYVEDIKWKGTIAYLTSDCNEVQNDLQKLRLIDMNLTKFAIKYNKCFDEAYVEFGGSKAWTKVSFGINGGYTKSTMSIENNNTQYFYTNQTYSSGDPFAGIIFTITYPRVTEKFYNQAEINFSKSSYYSQKLFSYPSVDEIYETAMDNTVLSIPLSFNYSLLNNDKMNFFLQGGGDLDFFIKSSVNINMRQISDILDRTTEIGDPIDFKKYHAGLFGGIGFMKDFNKFSTGFSLKYFYIINSTYRPQFKINTQKISLSLLISMK